jgi:hypothetical protein
MDLPIKVSLRRLAGYHVPWALTRTNYRYSIGRIDSGESARLHILIWITNQAGQALALNRFSLDT